MSRRCAEKIASVYRQGNGFALRGGGRTVTRLRVLSALFCVLLLTSAGAKAQPSPPPADRTAAPATSTDSTKNSSVTDNKKDSADSSSDSDANAAANLAAAREQQRATAATRQQIQAIRAALRARLAALHH